VGAAADPESAASALLDALHGEMGVTGGIVALRSGDGVRVLASVGLPRDWISAWAAASGDSLARLLAPGVVRESLAAQNPTIDLRLKRIGVRGVLTMPLRVAGTTAGAIVLTSTKREPFEDADRACLESAAAAFGDWLAPHVPAPPPDVDDFVETEIDDKLPPPREPAPDTLATSLGAMAVATLDADGHFLDVGATFERLLGVPIGSLRGESLALALSAEDEGRVQGAMQTALAKGVSVLPSAGPRVQPGNGAGRPVTLDLILSRRDGSGFVLLGLPVVDVVAAAQVAEDAAADRPGLRRPASGVMILDRRRIETSSHWRRWSGELLAVLGGSTVVLDPGGRIVELGSDWLRDDERGSVHWLGRHFGELFETKRVDVLEALRTVVRDGVWSGWFSAQGLSVPVYLRAVRGDRGELEAIVGARLPERSPEVRDLFRKIPVGLILVDCDLRILDANPELEAVLGSGALPAGLRGLDVRSFPPFGTTAVQEAFDALPATRSFDLPDVRLRRPAPEGPLVVQLRAQELRDATEKPVGFLVTLVSRTGKTQLENRLIEAQKMESIGNFASGLAHDFGNFVAVILSKAKALHRKVESIPDAVRELVDIEVAAKRAQHLSDELIRFARGGRSRVSTVRMNQLVEEVVALIETSVGNDIDVRFELAEGLPSIEGDEVELQQMILNLCLNARDAMERGGTLTIETRALLRDELDLLGTGDPVQSGVCVTVRDTGIGIPPEVRKHIFEPFFSTKDEQSNGLGLAMVYAIVRRHGGAIEVESEPGHGATFEIMLPGTGAVQVVREGRMRVLVADDEPAFREMIRLILEDDGHEVELVQDGVEALTAIHSGYDQLGLVILDLRMPGVDGLTVLEELRSVAPDLPVLVTSGWAEREDVEIAKRHGAKRILQKPYRAIELRQAIVETLERAGREGEAPAAPAAAFASARPNSQGDGWAGVDNDGPVV
jgi:signal transduction histidine kinase/CheY-like chemotaxis protein